MLVACVPGDKDTAFAVLARHHDPQVPEADVIQLGMEINTSRVMQQAEKVKVVRARLGRNWGVKEEPLADVDATKELPVAFQLRLQHPIRRTFRKPLQGRVELGRAEYGQDHALVEIATTPINAHRFAYQRAPAVAAHDEFGA